MKKPDVKTITQVALLVAMEIVLSRFCSIATPIVKIGFGFLPIALIAILYGPLYAGIGAAMADFIGAILFPIGPYFPGFTLTAFLTGATYGVFLYQKERTWWRIGAAVLVISVCWSLCLNTIWLMMITGKGYLALLPPRVLQCLIMTPLQLIMIRAVADRRVLAYTFFRNAA